MGYKDFIRNIIDRTPFRPVHLGYYIRNLYFKKYLRKLPVEKFKQVLDAGCSNGNYALEVAETFPGLQVTGVDIKDHQFPGTSPPNVNFRQQDLMTLKETGIYDFIYSIDVLEHIKGNITAMENLFRALKPEGFLFIHIPNDKNNKRILPAKFFKEFDQWAAKEHVGEQYSPDELGRILKEMGFTIIGSEYTFGFPGKLAWEIARICDRRFKLKILLMPVLKFLAGIAVKIRHRQGNTLVLAQKTHPAPSGHPSQEGIPGKN